MHGLQFIKNKEITTMILNFDERTVKAEQHEQWYEAIQIAYMNWKLDPFNSNALLCAISEIWYVLTFYTDREIPLEFISRDDLQEKLDETSKFAIENFAQNAEVNVLLGYYIDVMPYMFLSVVHSDYDQCEQTGVNMILRAYDLAPNDLFVESLYRCTIGSPQFRESCSALWKKESVAEWNESAVKGYFCRILYGDTI